MFEHLSCDYGWKSLKNLDCTLIGNNAFTAEPFVCKVTGVFDQDPESAFVPDLLCRV